MINFLLLLQLFSYNKLGMSGAQFLQIGMGARFQALASAGSALGGDASSIYWNPAGLSKIDSYDFTTTYSRWIETIYFSQSALGVRRGNFSYGLGLIYMGMDPIEITTVYEPEGTGSSYTASGIALGAGVSAILTDRLSVGFVGKIVREQIYNCSANGFAIDLGSLFEITKGGLTLGISLSNFGTDMQYKGRDVALGFKPENLGTIYYETSQYPLPLLMRVGLSYPVNFGNNRLLLLVQSEHPNDNKERFSFASELLLNGIFALRGGYMLGHDVEDFSGGFGLYVPMNWANLELDFAYVNKKYLKSQLFLSVSLSGR
uniref:PorV/PorQ family protein n=1 Tax=candidate division WOR-3 bacterium TaxID=2052148 RepID=A0A7C2P0E5_UNCW3